MFSRLALFYLIVLPVVAIADSFVGEFSGQLEGQALRLSISKSQDGGYVGNLITYDEQLSLMGEQLNDMLVGRINDGGDIIGFVAAARGDSIVFQFDAGERIVFQASASAPPASQRSVLINRVTLEPDVLQALEANYQTHVEDGSYWYDAMSGAWGVEGGPTAGFIVPGLALPGPMPANISGGGTGIYINGREIHPLDQAGLQQLFGITYRGHYWLDANGNLGPVGGAAIANVVSAIQQSQAAQAQQSGGSVSHGYGSAYGARGTVGGGMYSGRTASGKSVFWYPGM